MELEAFLRRLAGYDLRRERSRIGDALQALAQNRDLLGSHMLGHIQKHGFGRGEQAYNAYSFSLFQCALYSLRMTFWMPVASPAEQQTFIYGLPHTHDFDLYAVGYHGSGYRTVKYPLLNADRVLTHGKALVGEPETIQLGQGTLLHMRAYDDLHCQAPADEFSISLALVVAVPAPAHSGRRAWCFDERLTPVPSGLGGQEEQSYRRIEALWQGHQ